MLPQKNKRLLSDRPLVLTPKDLIQGAITPTTENPA